MSLRMTRFGSAKAYCAKAKDTPCLARLVESFSGSHSNLTRLFSIILPYYYMVQLAKHKVFFTQNAALHRWRSRRVKERVLLPFISSLRDHHLPNATPTMLQRNPNPNPASPTTILNCHGAPCSTTNVVKKTVEPHRAPPSKYSLWGRIVILSVSAERIHHLLCMERQRNTQSSEWICYATDLQRYGWNSYFEETFCFPVAFRNISFGSSKNCSESYHSVSRLMRGLNSPSARIAFVSFIRMPP